ncbi:EPIDERMAL PATTERNING FACTOR-like protein 2 [Juglans regia]|uniref:Epidermal patterning factor-like protein n=1 Tax=Juglans regia TaxID=51240 RepID=A0A2I4G0Z2_JUGRE|nr:EPIDERMAL PATTERNING FACTOR-like protein 2 [Juglans regia]
MDSSENCVCWHRYRHLLITSLLFVLLVSSSTKVRFMAEGRGIPELVKAAQERIEEKKVVRMVRTQIGSRPPSCERRCSNCEHCEAVQVPIVPRVLQKTPRTNHFSAAAVATPTIAYSRDGVSNYKPMCWKCKCGDFIFNP